MRETRKLRLRPRGPFEPAFTRAFHAGIPDEIVDRVEGGRLVRLLFAGDAPFLVRAGAGLTAEVRAEAVDERVRGAAREYLRRSLNLGADLPGFYARAREEPALRAAVRRWRGLRPPLSPSFWEAAVWAILNQQVSVAMAYRAKRRFAERFGRALRADGAEYREFPVPERVAEAGAEAVRAVGLTRAKGRAIAELAALLAENPARFDALAAASEEAGIAELRRLYGFGAWTAECALMMGAGHPDVFPALDLGLRDAAAFFLGKRARLSESALRRLAERWRPHRSLAAGYLWHAYRLRDAPRAPARIKTAP